MYQTHIPLTCYDRLGTVYGSVICDIPGIPRVEVRVDISLKRLHCQLVDPPS